MTMKLVLHVLLPAMSAAAMSNTVLAVAIPENHLRGGREMTADGLSIDIFSLILRDQFLLPSPRRRIRGNPNDDLQGEFIQGCESFLKNAGDDGIISQSDFANMLRKQCRLNKQCRRKGKVKFEGLGLGLQLKFIYGICPQEDLDDRKDCIRGLKEMVRNGNEFGFQAAEDGVNTLVHDMCSETYIDAAEMGFARTLEPTNSPSTSPTSMPLITPSKSPSHQPSHTPTKEPSTSPTSKPSNSPSKSPSHQPSSTPTKEPSTSPTSKPSNAPSNSPSRQPSRTPTYGQSTSPTPKPSNVTSNSPSRQPSHPPTGGPSTSPIPKPSRKPRNPPSRQPSRTPTDEPSTYAPSKHPIPMSPTEFPSPKPSIIASVIQSPSLSPSYLPTSRQSSRAPRNESSTNSPSPFPSGNPSTAFTTTHSPNISPAPPTQNAMFTAPSLSILTPSNSNRPSQEQDTAAPTSYSAEFTNDCATYLLSQNFLENGIISQSEFTQFLTYHCIQNGLCDDRTIITFEGLDVGLQLEFMLGPCSQEEPTNREQCIVDLEAMWRGGSDVGFDANAENIDVLVRDMCSMSYENVLEMGYTGTQDPTELPTTSPSMSDSPTVDTSAPPSSSETPSQTNKDGAANVNLESPTSDPKNEDSVTRRFFIGMSSVLALSLTAACIVYVYHRPRDDSESVPDKYCSKDANHFGIAAHEPWGRSISSLPMSYMGLNCSLSSTSSSFRDYRFVSVVGPDGTSIPQFNPNTAGAVVIGSVTIGASSSISSGPFGHSGSYSSKSRSFFSIGKIAKRHKDSPSSESGISSKDDMSSLSSYQKSPRYRAFNHRHSKLAKHNRISTGSSQLSRNTMPMSNRKRKKFERKANSNNQVSFGDWRAVSYMTDTVILGEGGTTAAAAMQQSKFFFDTLLCPDQNAFSSASMETTPKRLACQSLPPVLDRASSDTGVPSILSESYFRDASSLIQQQSFTWSAGSVPSNEGENVSSTNPVFIPWRKEGFSSSVILSDSKQSDESSSSTESVEAPGPLSRLMPLRPSKALFARFRKKTQTKTWFSFKHRQYHHLKASFALQEDPEVVSMKSYSSNVHLLPPHVTAARTDLPNIVLGTFAAATMPIKQQTSHSSPPNKDEQENIASSCISDADIRNHHVKDTVESEDIKVEAAMHSPETKKSPQVKIHISSLDTIQKSDSESFNAYSQSDFESSAPSKTGDWSDSSCDSRSSAESSQLGGRDDLECSFAAAAAPLHTNQDESKLSADMMESSVNEMDISSISNGTDQYYDTSANLDDEPQAVHLIGISNILSESESSQGSLQSLMSRGGGNSTYSSYGTESESSEESPPIPTSISEHVQDESNIPSDISISDSTASSRGSYPTSISEPARDESHIVSDISSGSDSDESQYHSDADDCAELLIDEKRKAFHRDPAQYGTDPQPLKGKFVIISDGMHVDESPILPVEDATRIFQGASVISPEELQLPSAVSPVIKGCDRDLLSISWESEVEMASDSIGIIDMDTTSFASTIPISNHARAEY